MCSSCVFVLPTHRVSWVFGQGNGLRNANFKLLWTKVEERYATMIKGEFARALTKGEQATLDDEIAGL